MLRVLILLVLLATTHAWGEVAAPDVTAAQLDAAVVNATANLPAEDPAREALLKSYAVTRTALSNYEQHSQQLKSFSQSRATAAQEAEAIELQLAKLHSTPPADDQISTSLTLTELEQLIQLDKTELEAKKSQIAETRDAIDAIPGRPAEIRERITELARLTTETEKQLGLINKKTTSGSADEAALWLARAQLASFKMEKAALEEELLSQPMRQALLQAQHDQLSYDIGAMERRSRAVALRAAELRQGEASEAQAEADLVLAGAQGKHVLVQQFADKNSALTKTFSELNEEIEDATHQEDLTRGKAEQLESDLTSIEQKLQLLGMSSAVGRILRERQAQLPDKRVMANKIAANEDAIKASSLRQVDLEEERRLLRNRTEYVKQISQGIEPQVAEQISEDLNDLVRSRRELIRKAVDLENTHAQELGDLNFTLRRYADAVEAYRDFISERLLWIPTRDKLGVFHGEEANLFKQVREVFAPTRWQAVLKSIPAEVMARPIIGVLLLLVLILFYYTPRIRQRLVDTGKFVGYIRSDKFSSTLQAVGFSLLLSLKWPLLLLIIGWTFEMQDNEPELATALHLASARTALSLWSLELLRIAFLPKGLVHTHFRWSASLTSLIGRRILILELTLLPTVFLVSFFLNLYPREVGGSLGTIMVVLALCSIAYFFYHFPEFVQSKMQVLLRDKRSAENPFWSKLTRKLLFWTPVAGIVAVMFGYSFTAIEVAILSIRTFVLLSCMLIFHELGLRWLGLARHRMTFKVSHEKAHAGNQSSEAVLEDKIMENDPELLNDEGTKLLNLLTLLGGLLGVAWIWAEIFPALGILDSVNLWHQMSVIDGKSVADPVTLADLLSALVIAAVGWVVLSRIPNLLEIFLRQKAKVHPASAYALTRVFQYISTTLLVIFVVGSLGGSWSSMQWAVAALSVGIGFGLQEIVANFICGLIILFEQPIRVGDIVTVGEITGKVTRIQMRATTIRDPDNRELLVPNKQFITSQVLNWSLTDSVTRRVIRVGVAYGTDMEQAMAIVGDVARQQALVLSEPAPIITFDDFGESSLQITLRYYLEQLDQTLNVDSQLRLQINRRFAEVGIEVAFPQRDIRLDATHPLEIRMVESVPAA